MIEINANSLDRLLIGLGPNPLIPIMRLFTCFLFFSGEMLALLAYTSTVEWEHLQQQSIIMLAIEGSAYR